MNIELDFIDMNNVVFICKVKKCILGYVKFEKSTICVIQSMIFKKDVDIIQKYDCLYLLSKKLQCQITPLNINQDKIFWKIFLRNSNL